MKIKTVGLLAAAAMTLTSVTVWSFTPEGGFNDRLSGELQAHGAGDQAVGALADADSWQFAAGDTLQVEGRLGHPTLAADRDNETYLYVNVNAAGAQAATPAPVNLAIVMDRSGSMQGKRMTNAIEGARGMVRRLRDGDVVSVITYNTRSQTLVQSTPINSSSRQRVIDAISNIEAAGDTCISCGVDAGMAALAGRDGMVKRVVLLSDGEATAGIRDVAGFERVGERARAMGCSITSIGVDVDYNERVMTTLAARSNGRHYFVENPSDLGRVFDQELQSLVKTVASNGELRVGLAPGVQVLQVFDRAFRREGDTLVVPLGTFSANENKTVLAKIRLPRSAEGLRSVADVKLGFNDLVKGGAGQCDGKLLTSLTNDVAKVSPLDPLVAARLDRSLTGNTLTRANELFRNGQLDKARQIVRAQRTALRSKRPRLAQAAPKPRQAEVSGDFQRQLKALDDADEVFASPPAASPAAAATSRPGRAAIRKNASSAMDMGF